MATKLGSLTLDLIAKVSGFTGPMQEAENKAKSAGKGIAESMDVASVAVKSLGVAAAGVSVAGITNFANQTIQAGSDIKRFAELSNSSLQQFQYYAKGAETVGISMESFADKMKDMQDRIGDFDQTKGGPLADFFTNIAPKVGVTIQQFQKLSGPEALQLFYNSLEKTNASQNDMKFYMESIISDSSLLIPLLRNGGEGFNKWGEAAKEAGAIMSDDFVESAVLAKEQLNLLNLKWEGFKNNAINDFAVPVITGLSDNIETVTNTLVIGTAYMAGSYIPTMILGTKTLITDTVAKVANTVAARKKVMADYEVAKSNLAATAAMVRAMGTTNAQTAAMMTNARTAYQQAAAAKSAALANATLGGVLGGPVGLGLTVAAVAGSYLMLKDSTKDTTATLDLQKGSVSELVEEYSKLDELQKRTTMRELEKQVKSLGTSYTVAYSDLSAMIGWLEESGSVSESTAKEINKLFKEYNKGKISSSEFATGVNNLSGVQKKHKVEIDELTTAHAKADTEYKKVKNAQQALINQTPSVIKANNDETDSIDVKRRALEGAKKAYTEYSKTALSDIQEMAARAQMQKMGFGDNQIAERMKVLKALNFNPTLAHSQTGIEMKKLADLTAKMKDSEDARSDAIKAQNKGLERQNELQKMVGASALSGLRIKSSESVAGGKVRGYTAEFAQLTQDALGDKLGRFTSFNDLYHKGTNSKHATGNAFDFTTKSAKDAELAIARLNNLAKQYGFTIKTLNEYSKRSARATGGHVHVSVLGYKGGEEALKDAKAKLKIDQDYNADRKKEADEVDQFLQQYSNADVVRNKKRIAEIAQAEKLGQTKLIPKINERFSNETRLAELQLEEQLKGWGWTEDKKLKHQAEINKTRIALSTELDDIEKQLHKESIDDQLAYELQQYRKTQLQKQFDQINSYKSIQSQIKGLSGGVDDIFAKATMSPQEYAGWSLKNNRDNAQLDLKNQLVTTEQNIATSDSFSNEDDRYQALLDAHQEYLYAKSALDVQYDQQFKDLARSQQIEQVNMWGGILSTGQNTFSQLAQSAKDGLGEQSSTYRTMFAMQQAFSVASSMVAAWTAYTTAFADPSAMTLTQKFAGGAAVMAALMPALTTIASVSMQGFATGGHITGAGTGTSDDIPIWASNGEFMLRAAVVEKLGLANLNYMNATGEIPNKYATGGAITLDPPKVLNTQSEKMNGYRERAQQSQQSTPFHQTINNVVDWDEVPGVMAGVSGQKVTLNTISRNRTKIRQILGV